MRITVAGALLLVTTSFGLAQDEGTFGAELAAQLGGMVLAERMVQGEVPRGLLADIATPLAEPPRKDPARAYRGQVVELTDVTVQRLTFRDPAAALEFAERHIEPPAVVDVRGRYVVAITGPAALAPGVADAALREAWSGAPALAPRTLLAVAEAPDSLAYLVARRGELWRQVQDTLRRTEEKFPGAPVGAAQRVSDALRVTWTDAGRRALRTEGSVHATCDARGPLVRTVVAKDEAGHARLASLLDDLARAHPAPAEGAPGPGTQAAPSVGVRRVLGQIEEGIDGQITAPIR